MCFYLSDSATTAGVLVAHDAVDDAFCDSLAIPALHATLAFAAVTEESAFYQACWVFGVA